MKQIAALFLLAIPFGLTAALAAIIAPVASLFYGVSDYAKNLLRAMDRLGAAVIGFSGRYTVSAEFGVRKDCQVCAFVCKFLDLIQKGHCEGATQRENPFVKG